MLVHEDEDDEMEEEEAEELDEDTLVSVSLNTQKNINNGGGD